MTIIIRYLAWVVVLSLAWLMIQSFIFWDFSEFNLAKQSNYFRFSFCLFILPISGIATSVQIYRKKGIL